ncbi:MAG: rhomboid family intramembrane serine protease [Planctomycetaceae bacterium]|nr:rhomboid family intramembrane serine protease [Planctomycetaceae bacterium]
MDHSIVTFWLVVSLCLAGMTATWTRVQFAGRGWVAVYLAILLVAVTGWLLEQAAIVYLAAALWFLLIFLPGLIATRYNRRFMQQDYAGARRLAQIIRRLHPADGWIELPTIIRALELSQKGDLTAASETLDRFQGVKSLVGLAAIMNLYRITNRWNEQPAWQLRHREEIERNPDLFAGVLRALGETGDVRGLVEFYDGHRQKIGRLVPPASRDVCRLMLFAFCGKRQEVERLFSGNLAVLPAPIRAFWLATADLEAGASESAKGQLEALLPGAEPLLQRAIERRLARISLVPEPLDASAERVVEEASKERSHEERFGSQRSLFSNRARATQLLMAVNVLAFIAESCLGGGTNLDVLYRLGGLFPPAVRDGEWWRLVASLFLHFGALHLAMNMLALWALGPFVEFALGFWRFMLVYLLAGIGSMATVMALSSPTGAEPLTVGASGCVMGLVGATGSLMLRGWRREKALAAKRRMVLMLLIVFMQFLFDSAIPQVSMTAHLSGAFIGFAAAIFLRDRLTAPATGKPRPAG